MRRSPFADRPERRVAPRTLSELMSTDPSADAPSDDRTVSANRGTRRRARAPRTLRNTT
ncbi:hypothetical protein [Actinomadura oligospora]|uniref:hypothetical protein n=1 Tax=Actinomadura oligospora TaxID=111804 RepID=UPI0004BAEB17|nr:hypothetical protein [Actinomadura oligospora]